MKLFGFEFGGREKKAALDDVLSRIRVLGETASNIYVTPENCQQSPTVNAIVQKVSDYIASLPVHVYEKKTSNGRAAKEPVPSHPVARLLSNPGAGKTDVNYWQDAVSRLIRYGNYYAYKSRGSTGPIMELLQLDPRSVEPLQNVSTWKLSYRVTDGQGGQQEFPASKIHHVRRSARNGFIGDSPVVDMREAIALEIAAEQMGASMIGNGAMPGLIFSYISANKTGFKPEQEKQFIDDFNASYSGKKRFRGFLTPPGMEKPTLLPVENDKAQFLGLREYQRTVIAGGFGIPPHLVGELGRATWGNVEQQSLDFQQTVILPYVRMFEAAMERDLLTPEDRSRGVIIRFNLDGMLRSDFKTRTDGNAVLREWGVINVNEWREREGLNPISEEDGGEEYIRPGEPKEEPQPEPAKPEDPVGDSLAKLRTTLTRLK